MTTHAADKGQLIAAAIQAILPVVERYQIELSELVPSDGDRFTLVKLEYYPKFDKFEVIFSLFGVGDRPIYWSAAVFGHKLLQVPNPCTYTEDVLRTTYNHLRGHLNEILNQTTIKPVAVADSAVPQTRTCNCCPGTICANCSPEEYQTDRETTGFKIGR